MILDITATVTDADGNVFVGSVAVTVNVPGQPAETQPAEPPAAPAEGLLPFQRRSQMMARGVARL